MKYTVNRCILCACVGLNVILLSSGFETTTKLQQQQQQQSQQQQLHKASAEYKTRRRAKSMAGFQCPKYCKCRSSSVSCRHKRLVEAPVWLGHVDHLETLTIQKTRIAYLKRDNFRLMFRLTELQLDGNELNRLHDRTFDDLIKLEVLNLSDNRLVDIDGQLFRRLVSLRELDLRNNLLRNVEGGLGFLANLNGLHLSGNRITSVSNLTFYGNSKVRILDLSRNLITTVSPMAFARMENLAVLHLGHNPLLQLDLRLESNLLLEQLDATRCHLEKTTIDSPRRLKDLRLSGNKLKSVEEENLIDANSVRLLLLDDNEIERLSDTVLDSMPLLHDLHVSRNRLTRLPASIPGRLYALYASHNNITSITWKPLARKYNLRYLVLSYNRIGHIDPNSMRSLTYLVLLDLSHNRIKYLKAGTFGRTVSLEKLDLSDNPLQLLEPGCFIGLKKLHILKMSSVVESMELGVAAFDDLTNLLYLDVSGSRQLARQLLGPASYGVHVTSLRSLNVIGAGLKHLSHRLAKNLHNLTTVRMAGNPWNCDARLLWIADWIRRSAVDFYEPENLVCWWPTRLRGKRLVDLTPADVASRRRSQRRGETKEDDDLFRKKLSALERTLRIAFDM